MADRKGHKTNARSGSLCTEKAAAELKFQRTLLVGIMLLKEKVTTFATLTQTGSATSHTSFTSLLPQAHGQTFKVMAFHASAIK